ncbi:Glycosyl transferase family 2 [Microbacterium sp. C448]|uniref:glycosyltransferase family 2 protein n=1 Tax=Microbacterium sp. C448 TaxID=1177594 RepID=UPI0003DE5FDC|nr:glycosyltransferase family 2 protein [Microbacterium sp. C448]CDJ98896.1 Glycosyl transferase family 2 [Microbacterium sp. C448]
MPRVSVVVRTKDRPVFLRRALEDITRQTYSEWEVVVVNDGGDGDSVRAVVAASVTDGRVRVIDSPVPGGRCVAANVGIRAATGDYIVLHDDDDRWAPEFLTRTTDWLDSHPDDLGVMVSTAIVYEEQRGDSWVEVERTPFWAGMSRLSLIELLEVNRAVPISFLYRRSLHDLAGWYDESLGAVEDWDFYLRVVAVGTVGFIPGEPLALWTQRPRARGADANSMFALETQHARDDLIVRDRALAAWIEANGPGLPLHIAFVERRISDAMRDEFAALRREIVRELDARHPIWSRIRRLRHRRTGG